MKINIKDTFTKANAVNYILMFLCIAAVVAFALMGPMVSQWFAAGFALLAGLALNSVIVLNTLMVQKTQDYQDSSVNVIANLSQQYNKDVEDLSEQLAEALKQKTELEGQLQALDNEYQKLAKQHNAMGQDFSKLQKKYDDLVQANDVGSAVPTTPPKPKKNPVTSGKKKKTAGQIKAELKEVQEATKKAPAKKKYSKGDIARIKEELKSVGMTTKEEE